MPAHLFCSGPTSITGPDGATVSMSYDDDGLGRVQSLSPPDRPTHTMQYSPVGLLSAYAAPASRPTAAAATTTYSHNRDRRLTLVTRPDGRTVQYQYDAANGRLTSVQTQDALVSFGYQPTSGQLQSMTRTDVLGTHSLQYTYDGMLPTSEQWTATGGDLTTGAVSREYDDHFRVKLLRVNGSPVVDYAYDADNCWRATSVAPRNAWACAASRSRIRAR